MPLGRSPSVHTQNTDTHLSLTSNLLIVICSFLSFLGTEHIVLGARGQRWEGVGTWSLHSELADAGRQETRIAGCVLLAAGSLGILKGAGESRGDGHPDGVEGEAGGCPGSSSVISTGHEPHRGPSSSQSAESFHSHLSANEAHVINNHRSHTARGPHHCSGHFTCGNLLNFHSLTMRQALLLLLPQFYR